MRSVIESSQQTGGVATIIKPTSQMEKQRQRHPNFPRVTIAGDWQRPDPHLSNSQTLALKPDYPLVCGMSEKEDCYQSHGTGGETEAQSGQ